MFKGGLVHEVVLEEDVPTRGGRRRRGPDVGTTAPEDLVDVSVIGMNASVVVDDPGDRWETAVDGASNAVLIREHRAI
jgi:hypothetical protein